MVATVARTTARVSISNQVAAWHGDHDDGEYDVAGVKADR